MFSMQVEEVHNVYDIVEESKYAEEVTKRREQDWIVDDDGGYVEDGREIFDDEDDLAYDNKGKDIKKSKGEKLKKESKGNSNIKNMLLNMPKKQTEDVKLDDDALLGDILGQIKTKSGKGTNKTPTASLTVPVAQTERNPFVKKGTGLKKVVPAPSRPTLPPVPVDTAEPAAEDTGDDGRDDGAGPLDEMNFDDFDEEMEVEEVGQMEENGKVGEEVKESGRGFAAVAAPAAGEAGLQGWVGFSQQSAPAEVTVDTGNLPTVKLENGEQVCSFNCSDPISGLCTALHRSCGCSGLTRMRTLTSSRGRSGCSARCGWRRVGSPVASPSETFRAGSSWPSGNSELTPKQGLWTSVNR